MQNNIFDINERFDKNETALIYVLKGELSYNDNKVYYDKITNRDTYGICELLLRYGADKTLKDIYGKTAYDYAVELKDEKLIELIK